MRDWDINMNDAIGYFFIVFDLGMLDLGEHDFELDDRNTGFQYDIALSEPLFEFEELEDIN